jgi:hypothetical protein
MLMPSGFTQPTPEAVTERSFVDIVMIPEVAATSMSFAAEKAVKNTFDPSGVTATPAGPDPFRIPPVTVVTWRVWTSITEMVCPPELPT